MALSSLSGILISIGSAAVLARYLSKAELGTYKQVLYIYNTLLVVFAAGLPQVYSYFLPRYPKEEGFSIIKRINRLLFFSGLALGLVLYFGAVPLSRLLSNNDLIKPLKLFALVPPFLLPTLGLESVLIVYKFSKYLPIYNTVTKMFTLAAIILPIILFAAKVEYAIFGWIAAAVATFFLAFYFFRLPFKKVEKKKSILSIKEMLTYSLPLVGASLGGIMINSADQFFISRYFGAEVFAEFSNGFIQLPFIGIVAGSAASVIMPQLSKLFLDPEKNKDEIIRLWTSTLTKSAMLLLPLLTLFYVIAEPLIILLYGEQYQASTVYFRIKIVSNIFSMIMLSSFMLASGNSKIYMQLHLGFGIIIWLINIIFILLHPSPVVVSYISALNSVGITIVGMIIVSKKLEFSMEHTFAVKRTFPVFINCIVTGIVFVLMNDIMSLYFLKQNVIISALLFLAIFTLSCKALKLSYNELVPEKANNIIKNILR